MKREMPFFFFFFFSLSLLNQKLPDQTVAEPSGRAAAGQGSAAGITQSRQPLPAPALGSCTMPPPRHTHQPGDF